ncbi:MAG: DUF4293 domain-containing protein [Alloprevotella sp.]
MIQRKQTLWLLLAAVCLVLTLAIPVGTIISKDLTFSDLTALGFGADVDAAVGAHTPWGVLTLTALAFVATVLAIFGFKNRAKQLKMTNIMMLLSALAIVVTYIYVQSYTPEGFMNDLKPGCVLYFVAYAAGFMARRGIRKDDELVKAADRIR